MCGVVDDGGGSSSIDISRSNDGDGGDGIDIRSGSDGSSLYVSVLIM